ncbi:unnamed protein product, partial [Ixodes pacificus]
IHIKNLTNCLESVQNKAARFILRSYSLQQSVSALKQSLHLLNLDMRRNFFRLSFFHSLYYGDSSFASSHIRPAHHISTRTEHALKVLPIFARTVIPKLPLSMSIKDWNLLPARLATLTESSAFQTVFSLL